MSVTEEKFKDGRDPKSNNSSSVGWEEDLQRGMRMNSQKDRRIRSK